MVGLGVIPELRAKQGATAVVEQQELRRHQTAPPVACTADSDSEEENVELPPKVRQWKGG